MTELSGEKNLRFLENVMMKGVLDAFEKGLDPICRPAQFVRDDKDGFFFFFLNLLI